MRLTQSEELLIQKSCDKPRRGAECSESCYEKRVRMGRNTEHFRKKRVFIFGSLLLDAWSLRNCVDFLLILSLFILLMCVVDLGFSLKSQQNARNMCKSVVNQSCVQCISRTFEKEEIGFSWCNMAGLDAESRWCEECPGCGEAWRDEKSNFFEQERSDG